MLLHSTIMLTATLQVSADMLARPGQTATVVVVAEVTKATVALATVVAYVTETKQGTNMRIHKQRELC